MPPTLANLIGRGFDPGQPSNDFQNQWKNPSDVFSVLLIFSGDVVARALAQLVGSGITPVAFSFGIFGWVAYAVSARIAAVGENKLMPLPDISCEVINAILIPGGGKGLHLEDLAAGQINLDLSTARKPKFALTSLAALWILLLITVAGTFQNTWFLLVIGGVGTLQNIFAVGYMRHPTALGVPLKLVDFIAQQEIIDALVAVERKYLHASANMINTFFPGSFRDDEKIMWDDLAKDAKARLKAWNKGPEQSKAM